MNEIIDEARRNRFASAKLKAGWTNTVALLAKAAKIPRYESAKFAFTWVEKSKLRNPDNISAGMKFIFDGLQLAGVIENDGWSQVLGIAHSFGVNKDKPGVVVVISGTLRP